MKLMRTTLLLSLLALPGFSNPLLQYTVPLPWDQIKPEHVVPAVQHHLKQAEARRLAFLAQTGTPTWANSIIDRDLIAEDLSRTFALVTHLNSVNSSPALRKEFNLAQPLVNRFQSSLALDPVIYARVKSYAATPEAQGLIGPHKRYLAVILDEYRRSGVSLSPEARAKVLALRQELSKIQTQYAQNSLDSLNAFELLVTEESELAGLPLPAKQAAAASAKSKGLNGYRFTLQAPSYTLILAYAQNAAPREKLFRAQTAIASRPPYDNRPIVTRTLELRRQLAKLLGYANFADYQTELRMAKSGQNVKDFLGDLEAKTRPFFDAEKANLLKSAPDLHGWDTAFYTQKLRQEQFQFGPEELRPYFELDRTLASMFALIKQLYGIRVTELKNAPVGHLPSPDLPH